MGTHKLLVQLVCSTGAIICVWRKQVGRQSRDASEVVGEPRSGASNMVDLGSRLGSLLVLSWKQDKK